MFIYALKKPKLENKKHDLGKITFKNRVYLSICGLQCLLSHRRTYIPIKKLD